MQVLDIMTKQVITVKKDTPLIEAAGILAKFQIHAVPVVNDENKIEGIITESDFFTKDSSNIYLPTFQEIVKKDPNTAKEMISKSEIEKATRVEDIMTKDCQTVKADLLLKELIELFKESNFNTFPVVDDKGTLIGIVTIIDIIKLL